MNTSDFFYDLPQELIAQEPIEQRDQSRLLCLDRHSGGTAHWRFCDLPELLRKGDLLVLNDSRVLPARLLGQKERTGGAIEFLLLEQKSLDTWEILVKPGRRARPGARFVFGDGLLKAEILEVLPGGNRLARFFWSGDFFGVLDRVGQMPLPHYITHTLKDKERYQTVYARENGSAAAPTAGLHFTPELMRRLAGDGIGVAFVTLHVGPGTFRPVTAKRIENHHMHTEYYVLTKETAERIAATRESGGRVIAVGTTSCRTLESVARKHGKIVPDSGYTDIFIYPGYRFGAIDGLITNFHLPCSTLIMLVSAFTGRERTLRAYEEAVRLRYRFYSFGDAMMIL